MQQRMHESVHVLMHEPTARGLSGLGGVNVGDESAGPDCAEYWYSRPAGVLSFCGTPLSLQ